MRAKKHSPGPVRSLEVGTSPSVSDAPLTVYFFHLAGCSHCRAQEDYNQVLANEFPSVEWKYYEVSDAGARSLMDRMVAERNATVDGVPVTIIGNTVVNGFDQNTVGPMLRSLILKGLGQATASGDSSNFSTVSSNPENASSNSSYCAACTIFASSAQIITVPIFGPVISTQMHPLLLAAMAGLGQAIGPCAIGLLVFWMAMGLVSGRSRTVQFSGIAFGAASAAIGLLFLLKVLDPYPILGAWRPASIALGAFALFWSLELHER